jgi:CubicO group peptidase (beta-lactamase class C family)
MRIFVTGGTGYVGAAVVEHLVQEGYKVTILVRSSVGEARARRLGARVEYGDLRQAAAYGRVAAEHDAVIHMALERGPQAAPADSVALAGLLDETYTDGFLVVKDGVIVFERYFNGMEERTLHLSQSVAKSVTAAAAGALAGKGLLDVNARITDYLPELNDTAYRGATLVMFRTWRRDGSRSRPRATRASAGPATCSN